jgi:hypothetical protein
LLCDRSGPRIDSPDQYLDQWAVVRRLAWMPESYQAGRVEHSIPAKLREVPLNRAPALTANERLGIKTHGAEVQQAKPPTAQTPRTVGFTLRVDPDLEEWEPGLKRTGGFCSGSERDDHQPGRRKFCLPLSQLRQVHLAGESTQISQEDQDGRPAAQVLHAVSLTAKVGEVEPRCRQAEDDGHCRFQGTVASGHGGEQREP